MPSTYYSKLRTALQNGFQRSIVNQEGALQNLVGASVGHFCNYRLFHSACIASLTELQVLSRPGTVDSLLTNRRRNISVVGALSRTFSVPSVSSPSFQVCGYHIDRALSDTSQISPEGRLLDKAMAACASRVVYGECLLERSTLKGGHIPLSTNHSSISHVGSSGSQSFRKASMFLRNREQPNNSPIYGYFMYNVAKKFCNFSSFTETGYRNFHSSLPAYLSAGTAPDVTYDNSTCEEQPESSAGSSERKVSACKMLKLLSGSCYLPHPDKEDTGGEDAHFICEDEQAIGVADGVGGWAEHGVDSGLYSRELMSNSVAAIQEEPKGSIDPARVLEKAHSSTRARGSSTACIIALTDQEGLHAINLGDSGFIVVRDGCTVFRSPAQQHNFNFTYQLEYGQNSDPPSCGLVFTIPVAPGDVIIAGTDGLFDNLYNNEITAIVVHAVRAGLGPQVTAQKIAALARQRAQDKDRKLMKGILYNERKDDIIGFAELAENPIGVALSPPVPAATPTATSNSTNSGNNVISTIFASSSAMSQQPSSSFSSMMSTIPLPTRPVVLEPPPSLSLSSSLYLSNSNNSNPSSFSFYAHNHQSPVQPPAMSATALLQKAAQMGAAATSNASFLCSLGLPDNNNGTGSVHQWDVVKQEHNSNVAGGQLGLGLHHSVDGMMGSSIFGSKPTTLDFLGLGMDSSALLNSYGGGFHVRAAAMAAAEAFGGGGGRGSSTSEETWDGSTAAERNEAAASL